jgi:DNA polymerase III delta subunit
VEEAAEEIRAELSFGESEIERIPEEGLAELLPLAISSGSLFSPRRLIEVDLSTLFGRDDPPRLVAEAVESWKSETPAGRREAFRKARALVSSLKLSPEDFEAAAAMAAKKTRRPDAEETLREIFRELPESKGSLNAAADAIFAHLEKGVDGTILLARAVDPPRGSALYQAFEKNGEIRWVVPDGGSERGLLARRAKKLAAESGVQFDAEAIEKLLALTDGEPRLFASELQKLLDWGAAAGRVRARDVAELVEDSQSEDLYAFFDALGRRDRAETMARLDRILSGRKLKAGKNEMKGEEPLRVFFGMLVAEVRRLLTVRARCDETRTKIDPSLSFPAYQARVHGRIARPEAPFEESLLEGNPFLWYKSYQRAARFSAPELLRSLLFLSESDAVKNFVPLEDLIATSVARVL